GCLIIFYTLPSFAQDTLMDKSSGRAAVITSDSLKDKNFPVPVDQKDSIPHRRPKIGLTLSGGGAKGLAHIGILKAIDSAGLKIDYISGTSMGGILGALYAIGYSADSLEKIVRAIDWNLLLSNQSSVRSLF